MNKTETVPAALHPTDAPKVVRYSFKSWDKPFCIARTTVERRYIVATKTHVGIEIGAIIDGEGGLYYNRKVIPVCSEDVYLIDPLIPHTIKVVGSRPIKLVFSNMTIEQMLSLSTDPSAPDLLRAFSLLRSGKLSPVFKKRRLEKQFLMQALRCAEKQRPYAKVEAWLHVARAMVGIFKWIDKNSDGATQVSDVHKIQRLHATVAYMQRHFMESLTLNDIAAHAALSSSRLSHLFQEVCGQSPMSFLNSIRLSAAAEALISTDFAIDRIAHDCGFCDASHLRRFFVRKYGKTPGKFRRNKEPDPASG